MILTKNAPETYEFLDELFNAAEWGKDFPNVQPVPPINIYETEAGYDMELSAPGLTKEDFKLNVEAGLLSIGFEQKQENEKREGKTILREFAQQSFKRTFNIDEKIDIAGIKARYESGILKVFVPKKEEAKVSPQQIAVE
jgi:HSP20 family protein